MFRCPAERRAKFSKTSTTPIGRPTAPPRGVPYRRTSHSHRVSDRKRAVRKGRPAAVRLARFAQGRSARVLRVRRRGRRLRRHRAGPAEDKSASSRAAGASRCIWRGRLKGDEVWFGAAGKDGFNPGLQAVSLKNKERTVVETPALMAMDDTARDGRVLATTEDTRMGISALVRRSRNRSAISPGSTPRTSTIFLPTARPFCSSNRPTSINATRRSTLRKTDGSPAVRLGEGNVPALSNDGKWVSCVVSDGPKTKLTLLPTGPGEPRVIGSEDIHYGRAGMVPGRHAGFCSPETKTGRPTRTFVQRCRAAANPRRSRPKELHGQPRFSGREICCGDRPQAS